jgi:hypothetical protein
MKPMQIRIASIVLLLMGLSLVLASSGYGQEATMVLQGGSVRIINPHFLPAKAWEDNPHFVYTIVNLTPTTWKSIDMHLLMSGNCVDGAREWRFMITPSDVKRLGEGEPQEFLESKQLGLPIETCQITEIKAGLAYAENDRVVINGDTGEVIDLEKQKELQAKQEQAARERLALEQKRHRIAAQEHKKQEERAAASRAGAAAEEEAATAKRLALLKEVCTSVYKQTADRKIADLTVK